MSFDRGVCLKINLSWIFIIFLNNLNVYWWTARQKFFNNFPIFLSTPSYIKKLSIFSMFSNVYEKKLFE